MLASHTDLERFIPDQVLVASVHASAQLTQSPGFPRSAEEMRELAWLVSLEEVGYDLALSMCLYCPLGAIIFSKGKQLGFGVT